MCALHFLKVRNDQEQSVLVLLFFLHAHDLDARCYIFFFPTFLLILRPLLFRRIILKEGERLNSSLALIVIRCRRSNGR